MPFTSPQEEKHLSCHFSFGKSRKKSIIFPSDVKFPFSRFPFNWENPMGYLVAVSFQFIAFSYCFRIVSCGTFFGFGCSLLALSSIDKIIKDELKFIDENAKIQQNYLLALNRISDYVEDHHNIKRFVCFGSVLPNLSIKYYKVHAIFFRIADDFAHLYEPVHLVLFLWSLTSICGIMLLIQMQIVKSCFNKFFQFSYFKLIYTLHFAIDLTA